jgi:hypothetical protein
MSKFIAVAVASLVIAAPAHSGAAPCSKHTSATAVTKAECMKAYRQQVARAKVKWPANPTMRDLRVRGVSVRKFIALGKCEAGLGSGYGGVRWNTPRGWKWQGGYGLYYRTHQSVGHPYGSDAGSMTWQEQTLVAERVRQRYGIHAWGAARCYING